MKHCSLCREWKPFDHFYTKKHGTRPQSRCKACTRTELRAYDDAHPERQRLRDEQRRKRRRYFVIEYLNTHPCVDCGEKDQKVLDFDHLIERGPKLFNIGEVSSNIRMESLVAEIAKCEVRCANCHRRKTAERNPRHWSHQEWCISLMAGSPGVEPRQGESKSPVLPLHHEPIRRGRTPGFQLLLI